MSRLFQGSLLLSATVLLGAAASQELLTPPKVMKAVPVEDTPAAPAPGTEPAKPVEEIKPAPPKAMVVEETKPAEPKPAETKPAEPEKPASKPMLPADAPEAAAAKILSANEPATPAKPKKDLTITWMTQKDARTLRLEIPAPRGQIVDRHGKPLAKNRVVYYAALNFPLLKPDTPEAILAYAKERINETNKVLGKTWMLTDERILSHYKFRRWLPMIFSVENDLAKELNAEEQKKMQPLLEKGLMLHPTYQRYYPQGATACHIVGYTGRRQPLPTKEIVEGEPFTEEPMGRAGLELAFEDQLRGQPGAISLIFSPSGELLDDEILRKPVPGNNVVTTLDYKMQRYAESALRDHARNGGAMVIVDVRNGDVLAMASNPGFDLNEFIPGIQQERFSQLQNDPKTPMLGRAFQANYYPASTFKVVTALAALESGTVTSGTTYDCDATFQLGKDIFRNWNKEGEGPMTVVDAIKRSCNTWFYQAGLATGSSRIIAMAERLGFGQATGIPIRGEAKGQVPTDAIYMQRYGRKILQGDLCSICIGQVVTVSPLQVAQCMAAVADGTNMPQMRLVKQVQDLNDRVLTAWEPGVRSRVALDQKARDTVVRGMIAVVSGDGGTGKSAGIKHAQIAGKTGTAQWDLKNDRNLAWFTGFVPADNPVYAFAAVYEGSPGENVSGGRVAAPIIERVFNDIYEGATPDDPLLLASKEPKRALLVDEDEPVAGVAVPKAEAAQDAPAAQPEAPAAGEQKGLRGIFRRLFRR